MNKEELRHILQLPYEPENWKKVVDFVFPNVSYLQSPQVIPHESEKVESFRQIGSVRLNDGKNLAMFEVKVAQNVNIPRNRVELRNLVAPLIDQERNHGVLVIYEQGKEDYRFTFTARDTEFDEEKVDFVKHETASKRFTYILGSNEPCRTPGDRFWELSLKKESATLKDVENAFSVERLSNEFFPKYKQHYQAFVEYLINSNFRVSAFNGDEKHIRDFVKVLLGRIVFLQFVQKKGWLGASDTSFKDGDKNFLETFWNQSGKDANFYTLHLVRLFFEALNKEGRKNEEFTMPGGDKVCIPFLGGGLFEKDRNEPDWLTFPPALFENLFNFFAGYNFTIDENDPYENEVGIDPEMLGHIFENLLEDNKDKGAFYTPKPIVKYMCQESLIQYMLTQLEQKGAFSDEDDARHLFEERVNNFVRKYEARDLIEYDDILAKAMHSIKVCDPAIGSGAFPMGILNEMVMLINVLHNASPDVVEDTWQMENWQPATVKKHIIQNSIYGVDIEKGAVDIARLRFWLSLVLDEEKPAALPSLDYKIVVGDSLVSKLGDEVINIDWDLNETSHGLFGAELAREKSELLNKISLEQIEFFKANSDKKKLSADIRKLKIDLLINQLDLMVRTKGLEVRPSGKSKNIIKQTELYLLTERWKQQIHKLKLLKNKPDEPLNFFDWKLDFPEIMNDQVAISKGFDIVIGNPPYLIIPKSVFQEEYLNHYKMQEGKPDLYRLFIEKSFQLFKHRGVTSFITPNTFLTIPSAMKLRNYIVHNTSIASIVNYDHSVFESASVNNIVYIINAIQPKKNSQFTVRDLTKKQIVFDAKYSLVNQNNASKNPKFEINIFSNEVIDQIISKLSENSILLGNIDGIKMTLGLQPYHNTLHSEIQIRNRFLHSKIKENENFILELGGRNIHNFVITERLDSFLNYSGELYTKPDFEFFEGERLVLREIVSETLTIGLTSKTLLFNKSCFIIKSLNPIFSNKFLLAILKSKLIGFYVGKVGDKSKQTLFPRISMRTLKNIPIAKCKNMQKLIVLVDQILEIKGVDSAHDTSDLERRINELVYKLYALDYNEVRIIEPGFLSSKEEYESLSLL